MEIQEGSTEILKGTIAVSAEIPKVELKRKMPNLVVSTLKELGPRLPVGMISNGQIFRNFEVIGEDDWTMPIEREIGKIRSRADEMSMGQFISEILCVTLKKVGPFNFQDAKKDEKLIFLSRCFQQDVMYMYVWLRYKHLGKFVKMQLKCNFCRDEFEFAGDLESLEVKYYPDEYSTEASIYSVTEIFKGMDFLGKRHNFIRIRPLSWGVLENIKNDDLMDSGILAEKLFESSIVGPPDSNRIMPCTTQNIDSLISKKDIEILKEDISEISAGPTMALEGNCPNRSCKKKFSQALDWGYSNFFSISSARKD